MPRQPDLGPLPRRLSRLLVVGAVAVGVSAGPVAADAAVRNPTRGEAQAQVVKAKAKGKKARGPVARAAGRKVR